MFENIALAFQGIWSHKMRSVLTMLGIIIGIAAIMSIVSTMKGTNEQIKQNLIGSGNNAVNIQLSQNGETLDYSWSSVPEGVGELTEDVRQELLDLSEVEDASFYRSRTYVENCYYKNTSFNGSIIGVDTHYFNVYGYYIQWGRDFLQHDYDTYRKVCIIDRKAMSGIYESSENPVGSTIEIGGEPFTVIGVLDQKSSFEPTINSMDDYDTYQDDSAGQIFIPDVDWDIVYKYDEPKNVVLRAASTDDMTQAGKKGVSILNDTLNVSSSSQISYTSEDLLQEAKDLQSLSSSTQKQLLWIASISLLVGGIGVMNIMLVSVTERTREIGLKKAIGAKKSRILGQFLTEAAVLTSLGGLIGVISGIALSSVISKLTTTPTAISIPATLIAVGFSMVIGIIFGLFPAVKAANLNPIEALRHE